MESIGLSEVGSALLLTGGMVLISIIVVVLAMWGVFKFFAKKEGDTDKLLK